ncbi:MAG TPA: hypothetical protein VMH83_09295 [Candidatus Acidoferrum sp.]|nr:hypothetical protein [Candidatus Acidoferrum sp.]
MNTVAAADHAIARLQHRLLHGPTQLRSGPHAGAVAGGVTAAGVPLYIYGEITGYYLHWLASMSTDEVTCGANARAAQRWLGDYLTLQPWPPTRVHLASSEADWRNDCLFAFDLAMIAGGLGRAAARRLIELDADAVRQLERLLLLFVDDGRLETVLSRAGTNPLPQRWSTVGGPFTAKTASRVLLLDRQFPLDTRLTDACHATLAHYAAVVPDFPGEMLHPTLYALEGLLLAPEADMEEVALALEPLLALQTATGSLPETRGSDLLRNDVTAQALRLAILLEHGLDEHGRYENSIQRLATALMVQVAEDGTIGFAAGRNEVRNTWCAMFADQALRLYANRERGEAVAVAGVDLA